MAPRRARPYRAVHDESRDGAGARFLHQRRAPYPPSDAGHDPTTGSCSVSREAWAGALAIEPLFVRIAFVVLALFSGVGILLYIACLALLADSPTSPPVGVIRRIGGAVAVLLSARWLFSGDARLPDAGWVVAIALLGGAVALWRGRTVADVASAPVPTETSTGSDGGSTSDRWDSWTKARRDRPRPPRSALGLLTIGAATVVGALVWLLAGTGNRGTLAFGWATVVLGAGLVVGTFAGRARWLIVPALATAVAAVAASALSFAGVGLADRSGNRTDVHRRGDRDRRPVRNRHGQLRSDPRRLPRRSHHHGRGRRRRPDGRRSRRRPSADRRPRRSRIHRCASARRAAATGEG